MDCVINVERVALLRVNVLRRRPCSVDTPPGGENEGRVSDEEKGEETAREEWAPGYYLGGAAAAQDCARTSCDSLLRSVESRPVSHLKTVDTRK